jgi:NTP pyrophosphatase (non-canonical NTP hydrolase)
VNDRSWNEVERMLREVVAERGWNEVRTLKDLAAAVAIEAAELQELYLWERVEDEDRHLKRNREAIESELADVVIYCLGFADRAGIDLPRAIAEKTESNRRRFPLRHSE